MKTPPYQSYTIKYVVQGKTCQNTFDYAYSAGPSSQAAADAAALAWRMAVGPAYLDASVSSTGFLSVRADIHDGSDLWTGMKSMAGEFGALMADCLPGQDACVLTRHLSGVGAGGRIKRGRVFFSGLDESQVDQGIIQAAYQALVQVIGTDALAAVPDDHQVWSPTTNTWLVVTAYTAESVVKTIRHRRPVL